MRALRNKNIKNPVFLNVNLKNGIISFFDFTNYDQSDLLICKCKK